MFQAVHRWWFTLQSKKIRDQKGLWINSFFRQMAYAMVSVLSSVFVFQFGSENFASKGLNGGLLLLLVFYILIRSVVVIAAIPVGDQIIRHIGYKRTIVLSLFFSISSFICLSLAQVTSSYWFVLASAVLFGLVSTTYWVTYTTLFTDDSEPENVGVSFGLLEMMGRFGQVFAPLAGVAVVALFGFEWLFVVAIGFLVVSAFPIFFLGHHLHLDEVSWREFWEWSREWRFARLGLASGGRMIEQTLYEGFWPVYLFLLFGSVEKIGWFQSLMILSSGIFTYVVAKLFDKSHKQRYQLVGVSGGVVFWVLRMVIRSWYPLLLIDAIDKFFLSLSRTFFFGFLFRRAKGKDTFSFVIYWEVWQSAIIVLALLLLTLILLTFGLAAFWAGVMLLSVLGLLLSTLITEKR